MTGSVINQPGLSNIKDSLREEDISWEEEPCVASSVLAQASKQENKLHSCQDSHLKFDTQYELQDKCGKGDFTAIHMTL